MSPSLHPLRGAPPRGDATRDLLVQAALDLFAQAGFSATTTRAVAAAAGVNLALIGYHFGGKQGLYLAVFDHILTRMAEKVGPVAAAIEARLDGAAPAELREALLTLCDTILSLMLSDETERWSQLILREQQHPTAAFDRLYDGFLGRILRVMTELVRRQRPDDAESPELLVIALIGQLLVWRSARAGILRLMAWPRIDQAERARIHAAMRRQALALLSVQS